MRFYGLHSFAATMALLGLATFSASAAIHYVNINGSTAIAPYTNWLTAATNIQDAVDVSTNGELVLVTNGIYARGGRKWFDSGTNRVTLTNAVTLQSVNGPSFTFIVGNQVVGYGTVLTNAARCVGMGNNAMLSGFTLTNGEGGWGNYPNGGGVANLTSGNSTVTNCILTGNLVATSAGGGAYRVKLINCVLTRNSAGEGGGACACTLVNCLVVSNTAQYGGGVYGDSTIGTSSLTNCTIVGNRALTGGGVNNGGSGAMDNCIVYYNIAPNGSNYANIKMNNCCTVPIFNGDTTSSSNPPVFVDFNGGNFRLQTNSPCINTGSNYYAPATADLDGRPRIVNGTVDMGAYEFQTNADSSFIGWLQQYCLPTSGSADTVDSDGDGVSNYAEWKCGTNPTNASSVLKVLAPPASNNSAGIVITWQSVSGVNYFLQRGSDLNAQPVFSMIQSNIVGQIGSTSFTDTKATNAVPYFYRVGVQ